MQKGKMNQLKAGVVLKDMMKKKWTLGDICGIGGFGTIYWGIFLLLNK